MGVARSQCMKDMAGFIHLYKVRQDNIQSLKHTDNIEEENATPTFTMGITFARTTQHQRSIKYTDIAICEVVYV